MATLVVACWGAWTGSAYANVKSVGLRAVLLDASQCAVEVEIESVESNMFNGSETLEVDGMRLGDFSPLMSRVDRLSSGDRVLFASPSFSSSTGLESDIDLSAEDCGLFQPGARFSFLGSFGPEAGSLELAPEFGPMSAFGGAGLTDLDVAAVLLFNLSGADVTVGTGMAVDMGGGGGCSVSGGNTAAGLPFAALVLAALLGRRRRRRLRSTGFI